MLLQSKLQGNVFFSHVLSNKDDPLLANLNSTVSLTSKLQHPNQNYSSVSEIFQGYRADDETNTHKSHLLQIWQFLVFFLISPNVLKDEV